MPVANGPFALKYRAHIAVDVQKATTSATGKETAFVSTRTTALLNFHKFEAIFAAFANSCTYGYHLKVTNVMVPGITKTYRQTSMIPDLVIL